MIWRAKQNKTTSRSATPNSWNSIAAANLFGKIDVTTSHPPKPNLRLLLGIGLALAVASFMVYFPARHHDFLNWDDQSYVTENDHVKGGVTREGIVWAFTQSHSANWHPVTWLSHMVDCQLYGMNPGGPHLTNALLHAGNAALLFMLLHTLTGSCWRSALVAGIFALHPLRVESVAWVSERKDVLSLCFGLLCLIAYARYATKAEVRCQRSEARSPTSDFRPLTSVFYWLTFGLLALGLMSKPMLVTWPFVMLLLDWWPLRRMQNAECRMQNEPMRDTSPQPSPQSGEGAAPSGKMGKTELSTFNFQLSTLKRLVAEKLPFFALVAASCIVTVIAQKQGGAVASVAHLPIGYRLQNAVVAYTEYLTKFFWPGNLSPIYPHPAHWETGRVIGAMVILAGLSGAVCFGRRRFPGGVTGWFWFLGTLVPVIGIVQVGSQAFADRYTYVPQIGLVLLLVWLAAGVAVKLRLPKVIPGILAGVILAGLAGRTTEQLSVWKNTETLFRHTLERYPENTQALNGLGSYYIKVGRIAEGRQMLEKVIQLEPTFVEARGTLADALDGEGRYAEAVTHYEAALALRPDNASLLNNLAWLRAACPDATIRDGAEALRQATRACELTGFSKPLFLGTLAAAQAEAGDFPAAIATATQAANLAEALRLPETAARNRALMELYRNGKAAHGGEPKRN
jgi:hypothetical protein